MSFNTFGRVFRFTTWGESHGPALGAVVDGCPPGLALSEADIQPFLDKRRPGTSRFTTQRQEPDQVRILSGVFEGRTTGTPVSLMIENVDQRSKDYSDVAKAYRPGHADYTFDARYGFRDYRGGGRSSEGGDRGGDRGDRGGDRGNRGRGGDRRAPRHQPRVVSSARTVSGWHNTPSSSISARTSCGCTRRPVSAAQSRTVAYANGATPAMLTPERPCSSPIHSRR